MDMASKILPNTPTQSSTPRQPNIRNPLPLSAAQEAQVRDLYYKRVRGKCADEIKAFAECARGRTVTTTWMCRTQRFAMNSCMVAHATPIEEDAAREEWFNGVQERRRKKEEELVAVEKRRAEVIELTRRQEQKEKLAEDAKKDELVVEKDIKGKSGGWWR